MSNQKKPDDLQSYAGTGNEQELEWNTVSLFFQKEVMVSDCVLNNVLHDAGVSLILTVALAPVTTAFQIQ